MMRRIALIITVLFCLSAVAPARAAAGKDNWISVRSRNFFLVGNAGEKEMRVVAVRLEQFREAFGRLLPKVKFSSPVPTTVIVFKSDGAYMPYKPVVDNKISKEVAGYFQAGEDVNYITLSIENAETHLERALALDPNLALAHISLGRVHVKKKRFAEAKSHLRKAIGIDPQNYKDLKAARAVVEPMANRASSDAVRKRVQYLLNTIKKAEERLADEKAAEASSAIKEYEAPRSENVSQEERFPEWLHERLRKPVEGEMRVQGMLVNIECAPKSIVYTIKAGDRVLKLRSDSFDSVDLLAHTDEAKLEVSCGPRKPESAVVIIYRPTSDARRMADGEAISFEFVPVKFQLKQ